MSLTTSSPIGHLEDYPRDTIVSEDFKQIVQIVGSIFLCGLISVIGLVCNVINMAVFYRMGPLTDNSTLTLLALTFADAGVLLTVFCVSLTDAMLLTMKKPDILAFVLYTKVLISWCHILFGHIAGWITAFITFHRCVCVVFPFKAKALFSVRRSLVSIGAICVLVPVPFIPAFASNRLVDIYDSPSNSTVVTVVIDIDMVKVVAFINSFVLRMLLLGIVLVCNQFIVYKLKISKSWREATTSGNKNDEKNSTMNRSNSKSSEKCEYSVPKARHPIQSGIITMLCCRNRKDVKMDFVMSEQDTQMTIESSSGAKLEGNEIMEAQYISPVNNQNTGTSATEFSCDEDLKTQTPTNDVKSSVDKNTESSSGDVDFGKDQMNAGLSTSPAINTNLDHAASKTRKMTTPKAIITTEPSSSNEETTTTTTTTITKTTATAATPTPATTTHDRQRRLIVMIGIISGIFLICNSPDFLVMVILSTVPAFDRIAPTDNLFPILMAFQFFLECFNSSVNTVVYFKMSTKYRHELRAMLGIRSDTQ